MDLSSEHLHSQTIRARDRDSDLNGDHAHDHGYWDQTSRLQLHHNRDTHPELNKLKHVQTKEKMIIKLWVRALTRNQKHALKNPAIRNINLN